MLRAAARDSNGDRTPSKSCIPGVMARRISVMVPPKRKRAKKAEEFESLRDEIEIDFVILADFAQAAQGKLNLIGGGWNLHHAVEYPSRLILGLGIGVLVPWSETNREHTLQFEIKKSEGAMMMKGKGDYAVGRDIGTPVGMTQRVTLGISAPVQVPEPGTYEVIVSTAGKQKRVTFEALPPKKS